jgi:hypothetical protein
MTKIPLGLLEWSLSDTPQGTMAEFLALHIVCRCQFRWRLSLSFGRSYIRLPVSFGVRMRASTSVSQQERRVPTPEQLGGAPRNARFCGMVTYSR